jgi:TATA-box binding protein (TBP) (component of TFIID and TFIIIB)
MDDIYFTKYKVSTITCNVDLGVTINLRLLYEKFDISEKSKFVWIYYPKFPDGENKRGVYPKKQRKVKPIEVKKTSFDNQVTFLYKANNFPNLKIFKNGNIQITGVKDKNDVNKIVEDVIDEIKKIYKDYKEITTNEDFDKKIGFNNFHIRMINTDFKTFTDKDMTNKFVIRRKVLHKILMSDIYNNKCSFEPGKYHGVKLEFFWNMNKDFQDGICKCCDNCFGKGNGNGEKNCKKITIAIFESGSVLITGGVTFEQIEDAYNYITKVFKDNRNEIKKIDLNSLLIE